MNKQEVKKVYQAHALNDIRFYVNRVNGDSPFHLQSIELFLTVE